MELDGLGKSFDKLRYPANGTSPPQFHPFPRLPLELRFKIYSYALPPPSIIKTNIHVDPSSNLSLTFSLSGSGLPPGDSIGPASLLQSAKQLHNSRSLLSLSPESRTHCLQYFPIALPCGRGKIRLSKSDFLFITNFETLRPAFYRESRLLGQEELLPSLSSAKKSQSQEWTEQITRIALPLHFFVENFTYQFVQLLPQLQVCGGVVWVLADEMDYYFNGCIRKAQEKLTELDGMEGRSVIVELMNFGIDLRQNSSIN